LEEEVRQFGWQAEWEGRLRELKATREYYAKAAAALEDQVKRAFEWLDQAPEGVNREDVDVTPLLDVKNLDKE
jgi:hypothetical protein